MLTGSSILLRSWVSDDAPDMQKLKNDIDLQTQLMGVPKPNSINKIISWLKSRDKDENMVFFVIARKHDNKVIGYIQLSGLDKFNLYGYLGVCLAKEFWGTGSAKESLDLLTEYATNILNLRKIILLVKYDNSRAIRFYKKTGFEEVGTLKKHQLIQGVWVDVLMMERAMTI